MAIILLTIAAMLFENVIGIKMYLVASVGAVLLVLCGILSEQEALASIHQPTVFLFAGVLALSDAIRLTGAGDVVAGLDDRFIGKYYQSISDHGGILYHSIYLNPDHVQPGNLYHLYSTGGFRLCEDRY